MRKNRPKRVLSIFLALLLSLNLLPITAFAEDPVTVLSVSEPEQTQYTADYGTVLQDVGLPEQLDITTEEGAEAADVHWSGDYNSTQAGDYELTAVFSKSKYIYEEDMPSVIVTVLEEEITVYEEDDLTIEELEALPDNIVGAATQYTGKANNNQDNLTIISKTAEAVELEDLVNSEEPVDPNEIENMDEIENPDETENPEIENPDDPENPDEPETDVSDNPEINIPEESETDIPDDSEADIPSESETDTPSESETEIPDDSITEDTSDSETEDTDEADISDEQNIPETEPENTDDSEDSESEDPTGFIETIKELFSANEDSDNKWSFSVKYIGQKDSYNVTKTENFTLKYQVNFHTDLETLDIGDVEIRIPAVIYQDRDGNPVYAGSFGIPQGTMDNPTISKTSPFNYYIDETTDKYVFWNYKAIATGTTTAFQILYTTQALMDIVDGTTWELTPEITLKSKISDTEKEVITAKSTSLTGVIDSKVDLKVVSKSAYSSPTSKNYTPGLYTQSQIEQFISGTLPVKYQNNFDDYFYVVWNVEIAGSANQPWSLAIEDVPSAMNSTGDVSGEVVGFKPFYKTGSINTAGTAMLSGNTIETQISYEETITYRYYVVTAYPSATLEVGMFMYNMINVAAIPEDGKDAAQYGTDDARWAYQAYDWKYAGDTIGISKYVYDPSENRWTDEYIPSITGWSDAYKTAQKNNEDYNAGKFYSNALFRGYKVTHVTNSESSDLGDYISGTYYTIVAGDDTVYGWDPNETSRYYMDSDDYYFSSVNLTVYDFGYDVYEDKTTLPTAESDTNIDRDVDIYVMYAGSEKWELVKTVPWNNSGYMTCSLDDSELANQPWRVKAVHNSIDYSTEVRIYVTLCIRQDSPVMKSLLHDTANADEDYFTFENLSSVLGTYTSADGTYIAHDGDTDTGTNYAPYEPGYSSLYVYDTSLKTISEKIYGNEFSGLNYVAPQRDNSLITETPAQEIAEAFKFNQVTNDAAHSRLLVDYTIAAYEGYQIYSADDYSYLRSNGDAIPLPDRTTIEIYDLLPTGAIYNPDVTPMAGYITKGIDKEDLDSYKKWSSSQTSVTAEYTEDYHGTGRNLVKFTITYTGTDPSAYVDEVWFQGFGVAFQAYVPWDSVQNSMDEKNIAAYIPEGDDITGTDAQVAKDDSVFVSAKYNKEDFMSGTASLFGSDINGDGNTDSRNVLYAASAFDDDYATSYTVELRKLVKADADIYNEPSDSAVVDYESGYTYSIITTASDETRASDITIFDQIENVVGNEWYGYFNGVDTSLAEKAGAVPVVYYSMNRNAVMPDNNDTNTLTADNILTEANGWYRLTDSTDKKTVQAIAVKLTGLTLNAGESVEIKIRMTSPSAEELDYNTEKKVTWNTPHMLATTTSNSGVSVESQTLFHDGNKVQVELYSADTVEVVKEFSDADAVPNSLKDEAFPITLRLVRTINGEEQSSILSYQPYDLYEKSGDKWEILENNLYSDVDGVIYLKAGQKAILKDITGGSYIQAEEEESIFWNVQTTQTITDETITITITNTYRPILYLTKTPKAVPDDADISGEEFTFKVSLYDQETGEYKPASGRTYWKVAKAYTNGVIPAKTGEGVLSADGTVTLKAGEIIAIFSDYAQQSFIVEEINTGDNWICLEDSTVGVLGTFGTIANITNYYKWKDLLLTKKINMQSEEEAIDMGAEFTFEVLDADGNPVTGNNWVLLDSEGKETTTIGVLNEIGQFTVACAAQTVKIKKLEADQNYTIREVTAGEYYTAVEDTATVTMPIYSTSKSVSLTNEWLKRDLGVKKTVVHDTDDTDYTSEVFAFTLYGPDNNPAVNIPYSIGENEYRTSEDGTFTLHADETAYFHNLGVKGEIWTVIETQNTVYPQLYPLNNASNAIELGDGENLATFVNGKSSVLMIQKTWNAGDENSQTLVDQINSADTETIGNNNWDKGIDIQLTVNGGVWPLDDTEVEIVTSEGIITRTWKAVSAFRLYPGEVVMVPDLDDTSNYQIIESSDYADMWLEDGTDMYHISATISEVSGTPATVPAATLTNTVTKLDPTYFVAKLMTKDSSDIPSGAVLTLRALQDDGTPMTGLNYTLMWMTKVNALEYQHSDNYGSEFAVTIGDYTLIPAVDVSGAYLAKQGQSDSDGLIQITSITGYVAVLFFDKFVDSSHLTEVPELSDSYWGELVYLYNQDQNPWAFVNSNVSDILNIYKELSGKISTSDEFTFKVWNSSGLAVNVDYAVYDSETNELIKEGNTGSTGTATIKAGQYAQIETNKYTTWTITELDNINYNVSSIETNAQGSYVVDIAGNRISFSLRNTSSSGSYSAIYIGDPVDLYSGAALTTDQYLVQKFTTDESGVTTSEILAPDTYMLSRMIVPGDTEQFTQVISIIGSPDSISIDQTVSSVLDSDGTDGSITVHYNAAGTNFSIYKVAGMSIGDLGLIYTISDGFTSYLNQFTDEEASALFDYITENNINPSDQAVINTDTCTFSGVSTGVYLVTGASSTPTFAFVPTLENKQYNYAIDVYPQLGAAYAILYENGTLVFQRGSTPDANYGTVTATYSGVESTEEISVLTDVRTKIPWFNEHSSIQSVEFKDAIYPANTAGWFYSCTNLTSFVNAENLHMDNVGSTSYMFYNCINLTSMDLSTWNMRNVETLIQMFYGMTKLESVNTTGDDFVTASATAMKQMFDGCTALKEIDLTGFRFADDIASTSTTVPQNMFRSCSALEKVVVGENTPQGILNSLPTPSSTYIEGADGKWHAESNQESYSTSTIPVGIADTYYAVIVTYALLYSNGTMVFQIGDAADAAYGDVDTVTKYTGFETETYSSASSVPWYSERTSITNVILKNILVPNSTKYWFNECSNLTSITGLRKLNTSNVTNMDYMFYKCSKLGSLDVSGFNTSKVESMWYMFYKCSALTLLDLSSFDTSNVENMGLMFFACSSLKSLDLSSFDTSKVFNMGDMFAYCSSLESLNVSGFDTSKVTYLYIYEMFYKCSSLTSLDLSGFNTDKVADMTSVFDDCSKLQQVTIGAQDSKGLIQQLPTPSSGYWYSSDGTAYAPADIPLLTADTYYASEDLRLQALQ